MQTAKAQLLTMLEAGQVLAVFAALLLVVAVVAWVKLLRPLSRQRIDGRPGPSEGRIDTASQLIIVAVCVSGFAALLAVAGLFAA